MKLLAEVSDFSLGIGAVEQLGSQYKLRKSARAILFNQDGLMATQYLQNYDFHKLPGGGIESEEMIVDAIRREVREEVGYDCEVLDPIGMVIEYRNKYQLLHLSYCYTACIVGPYLTPKLEPAEIEEGQITKWITPTELISLMENDQPKKYEGHFILQRELTFLREYLKITSE